MIALEHSFKGLWREEWVVLQVYCTRQQTSLLKLMPVCWRS